MKKYFGPNFDTIHAIVLDFDGVLTDNSVYVSENGIESVKCSRSDGLAFDALRRLNIKCFVLSTETNSVVTKRGEKLKIAVIQSSKNKVDSLLSLSTEHDLSLDKVIYIGNDINDIDAMNLCGHKICPSDSHPLVKKVSDHVLDSAGGEGVVRELVEHHLGIDLYSLLYRSG